MAKLPDSLQHARHAVYYKAKKRLLFDKFYFAVILNKYFLSHRLHGRINNNEHDDKELHEEGKQEFGACLFSESFGCGLSHFEGFLHFHL